VAVLSPDFTAHVLYADVVDYNTAVNITEMTCRYSNFLNFGA